MARLAPLDSPHMRPRGLLVAGALSLAGAALATAPAAVYGIDRDLCAALPPTAQQLLAVVAYLAALALLTLGWLAVDRWTAAAPRVPPVALLALGAAVHGVALLSLPYLSMDADYYAVIGRVQAVYGADPGLPFCRQVPPGDPILGLLPVAWRCGVSPYGPAFNRLAYLVAMVAGDRLALQLRLYQLMALAAMLAAAALTGSAARYAAAAGQPAGEEPDRARARAAACVLLCPLTVIEGTINGHNDALLSVSAAAFALCAARGRRALGVLSLLAAPLVKGSALLLALYASCLAALQRAGSSVRVLCPWLLALPPLAAALLWARPWLREYAAIALRIIGRPGDEVYYCTRAVECLPRASLHWLLHQRTASWLLGLGFRIMGICWLVYAAWQGARSARPLRWAATFLGIYYLYLHAFMQSWYLLSLLPLLPFAPTRLQPAFRTFCVSALAYYPIYLLAQCYLSPQRVSLVVFTEIGSACVVILPPSGVLLRQWLAERRARR